MSHSAFVACKAIITISYTLALVACAFRLNHRRKLRILSTDDYLILPLLLSAVLLAAIIWPALKENNTHFNISEQKTLYWLVSIAWLFSLWLPKISLALTLARMFAAPPAHTVTGRIIRDKDNHFSARHTGYRISLFASVSLVGALAWLATTGCAHFGRRARPDLGTTAYCNEGKTGFWIMNFALTYIIELTIAIAAVVLRKKVKGVSRYQTRAMVYVFGVMVPLLLATSAHAAVRFSREVRASDRLIVVDLLQHIEAAVSMILFNVPAVFAGSLENGPGVAIRSLDLVRGRSSADVNSVNIISLKGLRGNGSLDKCVEDDLDAEDMKKGGA